MSIARSSSECFDVLVVGGGISGLGVAYACRERGLSVLLIERGRVGSATSSNSLRIMHGGFRYLQTLHLARVFRSLKDQSRLLNEFAEHVELLPCFLPLSRFGLKSRFPVTAAAVLYGLCGGLIGTAVPSPRVLTKAESVRRLPWAGHLFPYGALHWHDLQLIDPDRFHQHFGHLISSRGGDIQDGADLIGLEVERDVSYAVIQRNGETKRISFRHVVDARGPWVREPLVRGTVSTVSDLSWVRACNLIIDKNPYGNFGLALPGPEGRQYFLVGRRGVRALGTEYMTYEEGQPLAANQNECQGMLSCMETHLSELGESVPIMIECGLLPAVNGDSPAASRLLGSHQVRPASFAGVSSGAVLISTKYTTFLSQGTEIAERFFRLSSST